MRRLSRSLTGERGLKQVRLGWSCCLTLCRSLTGERGLKQTDRLNQAQARVSLPHGGAWIET